MTNSVPIRAAIRQVLKSAYIAKETGNRQHYTHCREWLKKHIRQRNSGKFIFLKG